MRCYMWRNRNLTRVNVKSSASRIAIRQAESYISEHFVLLRSINWLAKRKNTFNDFAVYMRNMI